MAHKKAPSAHVSMAQGNPYQHQRGVIRDNALQALLHDPLFRQRIEKKRKGKGSYQRKAKHQSKWLEKPDHKISWQRGFIIGLLFNHNLLH